MSTDARARRHAARLGAAARVFFAFLGAAALSSCSAGGSPPEAAQALRGPSEITILFTTDEHGWLLPHTDRGRVSGGAAEVLGLWEAAEGHCPGPPTRPPCTDPRTLVLSGGDNYTGPAISTYFNGAPMAEAFARMGYAASAFGNHELDFGRAHFLENRQKSGMVYLAANLHAPPSLPEMNLPPYAIFERRGIKIGVVGLATEKTLRAAMASRFEGITFEAEEPALDRAVRAAWAAGPDMVVAIVHECPDVLAPIVERHPEWKLSFVGAGHCHKLMTKNAGGVPVIAPGWRLDHYVRLRVTADASQPVGKRVISVDPAVVNMSRPEGTPSSAPPDPELAQSAAAWKAKIDAALGEEIGVSAAGIDKESKDMGRWIAGAIRAETNTDVAIVNRSGLRQNLPPGPVTKASVWSILPFDNRVMIVRLDGAALLENLRIRDAVASGITRADDGTITLADGRPIDPKAIYRVATVDFLYYGGDHFTFEARSQGTEDGGADWREMVIAWTKKQRSSRETPLEARLPR
ncbi:5'-nucleotidase [Minicystis rosea]|nr:5'-nucleotidase [Minicystis rosea]